MSFVALLTPIVEAVTLGAASVATFLSVRQTRKIKSAKDAIFRFSRGSVLLQTSVFKSLEDDRFDKDEIDGVLRLLDSELRKSSEFDFEKIEPLLVKLESEKNERFFLEMAEEMYSNDVTASPPPQIAEQIATPKETSKGEDR